jgi:hypothetical protein
LSAAIALAVIANGMARIMDDLCTNRIQQGTSAAVAHSAFSVVHDIGMTRDFWVIGPCRTRAVVNQRARRLL